MADFEDVCKVVGVGILALAALVLTSLLMTLPVYLIWNHVLIEVVTFVKPCAFWQAFFIAIFMRFFGRNDSSIKTSD